MRISLRNIRNKKGLSLERASKFYGIKPRIVKEIEEYERIPSIDELKSMLHILGFDFDEIFYLVIADIERHLKSNATKNIYKEENDE